MATTVMLHRSSRAQKYPELVTGQANFIDNHVLPGMVWMAMVRPPYVHATINFDRHVLAAEVDAGCRRLSHHRGLPRGRGVAVRLG